MNGKASEFIPGSMSLHAFTAHKLCGQDIFLSLDLARRTQCSFGPADLEYAEPGSKKERHPPLRKIVVVGASL